MSTTAGPRTPDVWRMLRAVNRRVAVGVLERGPGSHGLVLLLATTGRRSGRPRVTPLQCEDVDRVIYVASARGQRADWYQNALAHPEVSVCLAGRVFGGRATLIPGPARIAGFLALRRRRHPVMMLLMEGVPLPSCGRALKRIAASTAVLASQVRGSMVPATVTEGVHHAGRT